MRKKIVMVDDLNFHLLSMKERLKKSNYEIYSAQNAETLFEILRNIDPALIILDINMPDTDGFEIIEKLKTDVRFFTIPVMFLTSKNDRESIEKGMDLGAVDYLIKPITDMALINSIENQLDPMRMRAIRPIILAIDDNVSILKTINHVLKDLYTVYTLPKAEAFREILNKVTPDLFLLDFKMPVVTGFDLIPLIREIPQHEETPIIFLTSEATPDNLSVAIHLGVADFIVKPIDEVILKERIAVHIADYMKRRRVREIALDD
jgi:putative two-component system response regulator